MTPQEIEALRIEALKDKVEALSDMVGILKAERDALAAQVRSLQKEKLDLLVYVADSEKWFNKHDPNGYVSPKRDSAQQCLRDIQAEAGRTGFVAGFKESGEGFNGEYGASEKRIYQLADEHATKVRQGGAE